MLTENMRLVLQEDMYNAETYLRKVVERFRGTAIRPPVLGTKAKETLQAALDIQFCLDLKACATTAEPACAALVEGWYAQARNAWINTTNGARDDFHTTLVRHFQIYFEAWNLEQKKARFRSTSTVREKIAAGMYESTYPYPKREKPESSEQKAERVEKMKLYRASVQAGLDRFKEDLFSETGMTNHPKREAAYSKAREAADGAGLESVVFELEEFVTLLVP